ncbi:uroporphyrinogen-III synthase [Pseudomonas sp. HMWF006]|uniref:uroporphyrinogen-III synthase n=1 Tax=Pseudomonas sp. HMWF006 TaxID=2056843 RepID=UPI000D411E1C|nr:uroporphyrinogen-III synthase [Pseudomonas sp. HMWF006]PTS93080.1 uroporphyrinogen-III synthase [Pseudomonas sp. HMWF006]PTT72677.1 uroporphyrinogen-III synthase [Pseudomonas sp. HMWF007]PTT80265.1 uroporphyrinogen-III synthase [Pseudomonas sp. HMWF005]RON60340.1 uroporphyrinogen-III synthase [Pseudomonas fluorescens]
MTGWRLLLTRPAEDCAALAETLAGQGVFSSCLPLLDIVPLPVSDKIRQAIAQLSGCSAVIVVSKPAARIAVDLLDAGGPPMLAMPWFSVGAATAQILRDRGLDVHCPDTGDDSEALLQLPRLREAVSQSGARVLILRGEGGRELLAERLRTLGASVEYLELYRRELPAYAAQELPRRIEAERLNGLVVSSGQGFEHLRQMAGDAWPAIAQLPLFVPSPRVAELARAAGAQTVVDCRGASAAALLTALREHPVPVL